MYHRIYDKRSFLVIVRVLTIVIFYTFINKLISLEKIKKAEKGTLSERIGRKVPGSKSLQVTGLPDCQLFVFKNKKDRQFFI